MRLVPGSMMPVLLWRPCFFGDGEDRSKSAAVSAKINRTPFIMKRLPEMQRGRGKESRHSRVKGGDCRGEGHSDGSEDDFRCTCVWWGVSAEVGKQGRHLAWPWGWWSGLPAGCGHLGSNGEGEPHSPAAPLEPNDVVLVGEWWEAEVGPKINLVLSRRLSSWRVFTVLSQR